MSESCTINATVLQAVVAHATREQPRECCGILLGRDASIVEAVPVENIAGSPNRFLLDPKGHIETQREARRRGLDLLGFYHSHPHSAPVPSVTDVNEGTDDGALHLIVGQQDGQWSVRIFRLAGGVSREVAVTTDRG